MGHIMPVRALMILQNYRQNLRAENVANRKINRIGHF